MVIEYCRLNIEDLRFAFGGSINKDFKKKTIERSDFHKYSTSNLQFRFIRY